MRDALSQKAFANCVLFVPLTTMIQVLQQGTFTERRKFILVWILLVSAGSCIPSLCCDPRFENAYFNFQQGTDLNYNTAA